MGEQSERKQIMFGRVPQWNERERDSEAALAAVKIQLDVKELSKSGWQVQFGSAEHSI